MRQISEQVFAEDFLFDMEIETPLMPNPYQQLPYLIIEDLFDERLCRQVVNTIQANNDAEAARLRSRTKKLDKSIRKTCIHTLSAPHQALYDEAMEKARPQIEAYFALSLTTSTAVQVLEYVKNSFYIAHADDSSMIVDEHGSVVAFKQVAPHRKISTVLFVSEYSDEIKDGYHFNGGELAFNYFKNAQGEAVMIRPKMGTLIAFASNPIYTHEVKEVNEGYRLTLVQWHDALL